MRTMDQVIKDLEAAEKVRDEAATRCLRLQEELEEMHNKLAGYLEQRRALAA